MRRNNGLLFVGGVLIVMGLASLAGTVFRLNVWNILWPSLLILWGVWLLVRPRLAGSGWDATLIGDFRRSASEPVSGEEFWTFIGDVRLDLANAPIPVGETRYRVYGFIVDVDVTVPRGVGIAVLASGLVSDVKVYGQKTDRFLMPFEWKSEGYEAAERKIFVETACFINDLEIRQG